MVREYRTEREGHPPHPVTDAEVTLSSFGSDAFFPALFFTCARCNFEWAKANLVVEKLGRDCVLLKEAFGHIVGHKILSPEEAKERLDAWREDDHKAVPLFKDPHDIDYSPYGDVVISNTGVSGYTLARYLVGDHTLHKIPDYVSVCNIESVSEPVSEPYSYNVCRGLKDIAKDNVMVRLASWRHKVDQTIHC